MLPLMFASGVGANGNISVGVGTVGGLLFGTLALLFIVPVLFVIFQYLHEKLIPAHTEKSIEIINYRDLQLIDFLIFGRLPLQ